MGKELPLKYKGKVIGTAKITEEGAISGTIDPSLLSHQDRIDLCWDSWSISYSIDTNSDGEEV
jgi:hypothetical protein